MRSLQRILGPAALAAVVVLAMSAGSASCGSGATGSGSATGSVGGETLPVASVIGEVTVQLVLNRSTLQVALSNLAAHCGDDSELSHKSVRALWLSAFDRTGLKHSAPAAPGTFQIGLGLTDGHWAGAYFISTDAACQSSTTNATAGTVTLTQVSTIPSDPVAGTFDLTFGSDHLSGSFSTSLCDELSVADAGPDAGCR